MESSTLYNISKDLTTKIKRMRPNASNEKDYAAAFIVNEKNKIFTGVTSLTFKNGDVENIPAEVVAFLSMKDTGSTNAKNLVILSLADASIVMPSKQGLDMLTKADAANGGCKVVVKEGKDLTIDDIIAGKTADEPVEEKAEPEQSAAPAAEEKAEEPKQESAPEPVEDTNNEPETEEVAAAEQESTEAEEAKAEEEPEEDTEFMFDMGDYEDIQVTNKVEEPTRANAESAAKKAEEDVENTANSISGVDIEESNPFFEAPEEVLPPVETIAAEEDDEEEEEKDKPSLSKEELLKQAKKRKKVAKANFKFKKKM